MKWDEMSELYQFTPIYSSAERREGESPVRNDSANTKRKWSKQV